MKVFRHRALVVLGLATTALALAVGATAAVSGSSAKAPKQATLLHPGPALAALVKRAQAEGTLNFYTVPPDASVRRVVDAFTKRYGVKATWTRFGTAALQDRFGAEASAGNPRADLILISNSPWFGDAVQKGWIVGPGAAGIPGWPANKVPPGYPRKFLTNSRSAVVQLQPSGIMYNKNAVSAADAPKTWQDLLDPKWKGKIILTDPTSSPAFVDLWWAVSRKNGGASFLERLRSQATRLYPGVAPLTQALASGEAAIAVPGVPAILAPLQDRGAPIAMNIPGVTTGPEAVIGITKDAQHPNAARLFAYWLLTPGGQAALNADPGSISPWDVKTAPEGYTRVDASISQKQADTIYKAFGVR
jgi:iron(III) transport system substrate-binding protein